MNWAAHSTLKLFDHWNCFSQWEPQYIFLFVSPQLKPKILNHFPWPKRQAKMNVDIQNSAFDRARDIVGWVRRAIVAKEESAAVDAKISFRLYSVFCIRSCADFWNDLTLRSEHLPHFTIVVDRLNRVGAIIR